MAEQVWDHPRQQGGLAGAAPPREANHFHCHAPDPVRLYVVMPGLVPGIHVFLFCLSKTWMAGSSRSSPAMTAKMVMTPVLISVAAQSHAKLPI
jgi:hypothetical protein